jgi:hypothetical protein
MDKVIKALTRAAVMMLAPRVWGLVWRPVLVSLLFWGVIIGVGWWLMGDAISLRLNDWQASATSTQGWWSRALDWLIGAGAFLLASLLWLMTVAFSSMFLISVFGMTQINQAVAERHFPELVSHKGLSTWHSIRHMVGWTFWFAFFWLVTTPAYFLAGIGAVIQTGVMARYNQKVFAFDALANHATPEEYERIGRGHNMNLFLLGVAVTLMGAVPTFIWMGSVIGVVLIPLTALLSVLTFTALFTFCGLAYSCYCLEALRDLRAQTPILKK